MPLPVQIKPAAFVLSRNNLFMRTHSPSRRSFLKSAGIVSAGFLTMQKATNILNAEESLPVSNAYGPLIADPAKVLDLPEGFDYKVLSRVGRTMSDKLITPGNHDGMAAFAGDRGRIILVCNHETNPDQGIASPFGMSCALDIRWKSRVMNCPLVWRWKWLVSGSMICIPLVRCHGMKLDTLLARVSAWPVQTLCVPGVGKASK